MTNGEKLREIFPKTIFVQHKESDKLTALVCSDEWLSAEYQEPIPKNDLGVDVVSRKNVHDMLENLPVTVEDKWFNWLQKACMRLAELPSVTPQTRKGHWIGHREHCENLGVMPSGLGAYKWCSNCDCGIDVREWYRSHYNYCPNCGSYNGGDSNGNE